jgi:uncharacterized protein (TIGR02421 family)
MSQLQSSDSYNNDVSPHDATDEVISNELIDAICLRLSQDKRIRETLPLEGRLHIDRPLPFLCVYRQPPHRPDEGTEQLVKGEAAHLIVSGTPQLKSSVSALIWALAKTLAEKFETFLVIEIWSAQDVPARNNSDPIVPKPGFRIITSRARPPTQTVEALGKALKSIKVQRQTARVEVVYSQRRYPAGLSPLIRSADAKRVNCFVIGLEVSPIYRAPATGKIFPVVLRILHRGVARALKQAFFEYSHAQTTYSPENYQVLGRRAVVKAVWNVDRRLAEISNSFDFLLQVTPVNTNPAWIRFKQRHFERPPVFYYRPLPVDPAFLKRKLYQIPLERVEDPTLAFLFRQKRVELDRQLSMLGDRGTRKFLYGGLQLYGDVSDELLELAHALLTHISPRSRENSLGGHLNAATFAARARAEIEYYRQTYPDISAQVYVRDDTVGLMVSQGNLLIGRQVKIPASRVEALLQHEVGTHVLTYFNGRSQPFQQLYAGMAGYEELQEGLAVLAEYLVGGLSRPRLRLLAGRVVAARFLIDGATFIDTFRQLNRTYSFDQYTAFTITWRIYRGGGLTKDAVYLRGLVKVLEYLKNGGDLKPLFVGKITAEHISLIQELQWRQVLHPAPLQPRYMDQPQTATRLAHLRDGATVLDLIERRRK